MSSAASLLYRLTAAVLLAWLIGGAVASPLTACCASSEPCCVATPSGQGCIGCVTAPAATATDPLAGPVAPSHARPTVAFSSKESVTFQPWKPPD